ncbi:MAG: hypothetical protein FAF03_12330 [Epsilonproteobacteria bacterium]|nr:hypothetical protein [Campylobacterota bacterium]
MHGESQANRLASLMQKHKSLPSYELALPLVTVPSLSLDNLEVDDVLLLRLEVFECILLNNDILYANVIPVHEKRRVMIKVLDMVNKKVSKTQRKEHEVLKLSFGTVQSRSLEVGHKIDVSQMDLTTVSLMRKKKKIATASLINVDGKMAVKVDKVEKNG